MHKSVFIDTLKGKPHSRPAVWYMRQAGRVLPSYLELKKNHSFWEMMQTPELAAKITLLPVNDLGVDAAILFSDILVIPYAMGMGLEFTDNGPVFEDPLRTVECPLDKLNPQPEKLEFVYRVIDEIINTRPSDVPLIGFCGGPLTVLCYMIQGIGSNSMFPDAINFFYKNKSQTIKLVDAITELSAEYMLGQIEHGIDAFQLFETHAGLVPSELYAEIFMRSVSRLGKLAKEKEVPFIFFPKGLGTGLAALRPEDCDFVGIDWQVSIQYARKIVNQEIGLQGNLDPRLLFADKKVIEAVLKKFVDFGSSETKWIFNLGHGFIPETPFENARFITDWIKNANWNRD